MKSLSPLGPEECTSCVSSILADHAFNHDCLQFIFQQCKAREISLLTVASASSTHHKENPEPSEEKHPCLCSICAGVQCHSLQAASAHRAFCTAAAFHHICSGGVVAAGGQGEGATPSPRGASPRRGLATGVDRKQAVLDADAAPEKRSPSLNLPRDYGIKRGYQPKGDEDAEAGVRDPERYRIVLLANTRLIGRGVQPSNCSHAVAHMSFGNPLIAASGSARQ